MLLLSVLSSVLEWIEITQIARPLFLPILQNAGVDMVWLGVLVAMNPQTSFLTPPFGWALVSLKGVAPPCATTGDISRGVLAFIGLQVVGLACLFFFPGLATGLPNAIGC